MSYPSVEASLSHYLKNICKYSQWHSHCWTLAQWQSHWAKNDSGFQSYSRLHVLHRAAWPEPSIHSHGQYHTWSTWSRHRSGRTVMSVKGSAAELSAYQTHCHTRGRCRSPLQTKWNRIKTWIYLTANPTNAHKLVIINMLIELNNLNITLVLHLRPSG